ncbi:MAG: archaetidylserine decarboxylase [Bdellovibrionota bacterium]
MKNKIFDVVMPVLPKNDLSHMVGRLVHIPLPGVVGRRSVEWFAKMYDIDLSEAELPVERYRSIGELFMRKLKPGVRPIGEGIVHPADAVITEGGPIQNQTLIQAKGKTYTVGELLKTDAWTAAFEGGQYMTYYLCPTDYHRVHSPADGNVVWSSHIPGELWPVNDWSVNAIHNLFAVNERVALVIETPKGKVALIMVAATNVGNMTMTFDSEIATTKRPSNRKITQKKYEPALPIARGEEVGIFRMGSTVVMLYEKGVIEIEAASTKNHRSKMGASVQV